MRDFHSLSVLDQLYRLAEIAHEPHTRSHRDRRACVAIIFRVATSHTAAAPPASPPAPAPPPSAPLPASSSPPPPPPPSAAAAHGFSPSGYSRYLNPTPSFPRLISAIHALSQQPPLRHPSAHLQLLFIQRARNPRDRWSGQMALPGGRQQRGESEFNTAVREVMEEVGLRLWESECWLYVGRMSDRPINSFGNVKPLAVCPFIFLQLSRATPPLSLEEKEVAAAVWTPLRFFSDPQVQFAFIVHPLVRSASTRWRRSGRSRRRLEVGFKVKRREGVPASASSASDTASTLSASSASPPSPSSPPASSHSHAPAFRLPHLRLPSISALPSVHFPALALPGQFETADGRHGVSLGDTLIYQHTAEQQRQRQHNASRRQQQQQQQQQPASPVAAPPLTGEAKEAEDDEDDSDDEDDDASLISGDELSSPVELDVDIEPAAFILWGFSLLLISDLLSVHLHCSSLSSHIDKGQKDRQRMLAVLHRGIDVMDGVDRRWKGIRRAVRGAIGTAPATAAGAAGDSKSKGESRPPTAAGVEIRVHPELAAAASSEEQRSSSAGRSVQAVSKL